MDPTDRLLEGILKGVKAAAAESPDHNVSLVITPKIQPASFEKKSRDFLLESIKGRHIWFFYDWEETAVALKVGARIWPDKVWNFYYIESDDDPEILADWIVTAHDPLV